MKTTNKKEWEITILQFKNHEGIKFKVTRRLPNMSVAETKIFRTKEEAQEQINKWLE